MRHVKKLITAAAFCCLMILIESCSSSTLVSVWNDPTYHEPPLKKILIIAVMKDPIHRRIWEDAFVGEFSEFGVSATSSYHLFPNALPDTNEVIKAVQENDYDGILVARHLIPEAKTHYVPGYVSSELKSRYDPFKETYSSYFRDVEHPSYIDSLIVKRRAIEVWAIRNKERIIWAATSNTPDLNTVEAVQNDITNLVVDDLARNAIIRLKK